MAFLFLIFFKVLDTLPFGRYNIYVQYANWSTGERSIMEKGNTRYNSALYTGYNEKNICGENYAGFSRYCRKAARAVIVEHGKVLLSHEVNVGQWVIPGGGMDGNETPEECCVREAAEETGLLVKPKSCFLVINEFYEDWKFVSYYFVCEVEGHTDRNPTKREIEVGAVPEWLEIGQAAEIFSHYGDYAGSDEERRGIYLREHLALSEFSDKYN